MNNIKGPRVIECRVLSIVGAFWQIMDSIDDQKVRENFLKNLLGLSSMEEVEKIRKAKEATPAMHLNIMINFLKYLKKRGQIHDKAREAKRKE